MTCSDVRNRLMAVGDARELPRADRGHIDTCDPCRSYLVAVRRLDSGLRQLPVPADSPEARERTMSQFQSDMPLPFAQAKKGPNRFWIRWTAGVAAAVMFTALGVNVYRAWEADGPGGTPAVVEQPNDEFLAKLMARHAELMTAKSAHERVTGLHRLATDLSEQSRQLIHVAKAEDMAELAKWYDHVVRAGVMARAGRTTELEPAALQRMAKEMARTGAQIDAAAEIAPAGSVRHLRRIARTAREGDEYLRELIREGV